MSVAGKVLTLYVSLIQPSLKYACQQCQVWNPYLTIIEKLEKVQRFALRLCFKQWDLDIRLFLLFLTSQHLPHGGNTLTSAQCSTLSTSCYTSLKKSLSLEPLLYTRQITYTVSLFVGLTRTLTHLYQRHAQTGTHSLFQ